jgi:CelD/BcsL family acetyltransferase involved in cellulose biosynthesis
MAQATHAAFNAPVDDADIDEMPAGARIFTGGGAPDIRISIHRDLADAEREWRAFEQTADCTVFQSYEWLSAWQRNIGARTGVVPAIVMGRDGGGALLFIAPLAIEPRGFVRELTWLGSDLCDYNSPLLAPEFSRLIGAARFMPVWRAIVTTLGRDPALRHDVVRFTKMPAKIGSQDNPFLALGAGTHPSGAYLTKLAGDWETFYNEKRSGPTRRRDRTKRKKLGEFGEVRFVNPQAGEIGSTLETLFVQKAASFAHMGVANLFAKPGHSEFYREIAADPAMREMVHISRLDVGDVQAAINLGLIFHGCYYHVLASYDAGEVSKYGPGAAHLHDLMAYAIEKKCNVFDFTIGDERYKRDWSDTELTLFDHVSAATLRGWPVVLMSSGFSKLKRFIKQTPVLWDAFQKARAFAASLKPKS